MLNLKKICMEIMSNFPWLFHFTLGFNKCIKISNTFIRCMKIPNTFPGLATLCFRERQLQMSRAHLHTKS